MNALEFYTQELQGLDRSIALLQKRFDALQIARGVTGLGGLLLIGVGCLSELAPRGTWQTGLATMIAFLAIATWQETIAWKLAWHRQRHVFFQRMIARTRRHWDQIPAIRSEAATSEYHSALTDDLDVFGDRSLFRWLSLAATDSGAQMLASWLTRLPDESTIIDRQRSVRHLAADRAWRLRFWDATHAFRSGESRPETILAWCAQKGFYEEYPFLRWLTWLGPLAAIMSLVLMFAGISSGNATVAGIGLASLLASIAVNLIITVGFIGRVHDIFVKIGGANRELQSLIDLLQCVEQMDAPESLLARLRESFRTPGGWAKDALRTLRFRMHFAGLQRNPLFFIPYVMIQVLLLWDFQVLKWLDAWKSRHLDHSPKWMDALAQYEALVSAAAVADEYPDWGYPTLTREHGADVRIDALAHPLLPDTVRVPNDLSIEPSRPLLLVTGSNMAGKSTLLRSLGVNLMLSRVGSPVACRSWVSPNSALASSIRVRDSLQDGVSFFMAELKRLKTIVDEAHGVRAEQGIPMLILLDEILQGTNSRERQIAVQSVLQHLVSLGCHVVASTHDLELAQAPLIVSSAQVVHFREFFAKEDGREVMRFDYKMHPGVTPTTNALKLLEMVGLGNRQQP